MHRHIGPPPSKPCAKASAERGGGFVLDSVLSAPQECQAPASGAAASPGGAPAAGSSAGPAAPISDCSTNCSSGGSGTGSSPGDLDPAAILGDPHRSSSFGSKSIGLWGGSMLLANNVAGPTVSLMPALTQQAGWLAMVVVLVSVGIVSAVCGKLLLAAMRGMPKNENFQMRVEFPDLLRFYLPRSWYLLSMLVYLGFMVLTLMTYVIQTAQVLDYAFVHSTGYAWGLQLYPDFGPMRGAETHSSTPFGDSTVVSVSFLVLAMVCGPLSYKNLDDNVPLQVLSIVGLTLLAAVWLTILPGMPDFPSQLPMATSSVHNVIGTTLFNFAFVGSLPSWANEKLPEVSVNRSFAFSLGYVVIVYAAVGIVGGLAYEPYYVTDENLFSKLNVSGQLVARLTVFLYPILQNFTSIPVFSIILRYNFMQLGWLGPRAAANVAFALPWVLSIFFYTGHGFEMISNWGGLFFSSVVNFLLPVVLFALCGLRKGKLHKMEP